LDVGRIEVSLSDDPDFTTIGTMNRSGALSGMSKVYRHLNLNQNDVVEADGIASTKLQIVSVRKPSAGIDAAAAPEPLPEGNIGSAATTMSVFQRRGLKSIYIELFALEILNRLTPENEPDVYMVFGVLQEYTSYRYCCATSKALLTKLGFMADTKPDAVLVDDETSEYLVAEFKMRSSAFALNHQPDDVDVLIVWEDDERDRSRLPRAVVSLRDIARTAAKELIES